MQPNDNKIETINGCRVNVKYKKDKEKCCQSCHFSCISNGQIWTCNGRDVYGEFPCDAFNRNELYAYFVKSPEEFKWNDIKLAFFDSKHVVDIIKEMYGHGMFHKMELDFIEKVESDNRIDELSDILAKYGDLPTNENIETEHNPIDVKKAIENILHECGLYVGNSHAAEILRELADKYDD